MPKLHVTGRFDAAAIRLIALGASIVLAGCASSKGEVGRGEARLNARATDEIYASCDNAFVLYVNDREMMRNANWEVPLNVPVSLKPGDVIKVRVSDFGGGYGFAFLYCSADKTKYFSANTNNWYTYAPANEVTWWKVPDIDALKLGSATEGTTKVVAAQLEFRADAPCKSAIWGKSGEPTAFLLHVVSKDDLKVRKP